MPTSPPTLKPPVGQDVSFCDHSRQPHGILERKRVQRSTEADTIRPLRRRGEHSQWVRRNRKLLEEMMINHRVNIESAIIRVLDLPHDLPGLVVMRLPQRGLHFAINPKPHQVLSWGKYTSAKSLQRI